MEKKGRVQSPSSIKTFKQCPRKYYYQYIEEIPVGSNIHQVRGNIAHSALEHFFDIDTSTIDLDSYETHLKIVMQRLLLNEWKLAKEKLDEIGLPKDQEMQYFEETMMMLLNWVGQFCKKVAEHEGTFQERFAQLTPIREQLYESETFHAKGFIDVIEKKDGQIRLMDYKTNKRININDHILQLGIYALLYHDKHGHLPNHVGVYFLKGKEMTKEVDEELLELARKEIAHVHERTISKQIDDYPRKTSPLCKWRTGQCDFYDTCKPHG